MKHTLESLRARTTEDGDCLIWTGSDNGKGIPKVKNGNGGMGVRRVVWELRKGKIPEGKQVIVTCGHAGCIEHLALATKAQVSKAAQSRPDVRAHRSATSAKAARAKAKLTMELARQIRNDPREGIVVAAELGVCKSTVSHVRRNRTWVDRSNPFAGLVAMNDSKRKAA